MRSLEDEIRSAYTNRDDVALERAIADIKQAITFAVEEDRKMAPHRFAANAMLSGTWEYDVVEEAKLAGRDEMRSLEG